MAWPKNSDKDKDNEEGSDKEKDKDNFTIFKIFPEIVRSDRLILWPGSFPPCWDSVILGGSIQSNGPSIQFKVVDKEGQGQNTQEFLLHFLGVFQKFRFYLFKSPIVCQKYFESSEVKRSTWCTFDSIINWCTFQWILLRSYWCTFKC